MRWEQLPDLKRIPEEMGAFDTTLGASRAFCCLAGAKFRHVLGALLIGGFRTRPSSFVLLGL